jgi:hypothetical protein
MMAVTCTWEGVGRCFSSLRPEEEGRGGKENEKERGERGRGGKMGRERERERERYYRKSSVCVNVIPPSLLLMIELSVALISMFCREHLEAVWNSSREALPL